jgi:hypothetical protein
MSDEIKSTKKAGKKLPGRPFKKGKPGGPGRPPMAPELKGIPRLTKEQVEACIAKYQWMGLDELEVAMKDEKRSMLEHMIMSIIHKAVVQGDQGRMEFLLNRTIGKVKDITEIQLPEPTFVKRLNGEVIELGAEMIEEKKDG